MSQYPWVLVVCGDFSLGCYGAAPEPLGASAFEGEVGLGYAVASIVS